nr:MAG TPA: hypothetical protein [Caudoviricetes sp.]DAX14064.1 MAG TPA: hypothetical protein [Bacteriophage sp.]
MKKPLQTGWLKFYQIIQRTSSGVRCFYTTRVPHFAVPFNFTERSVIIWRLTVA